MAIEAIKPIETVYNGYRFRSRLEARWAVFFDTLGVPYEYEKEGYDLGEAGYYLPDFWLPVHKLHVEIKPDGIPDNDRQRLAGITIAMARGGQRLLVLFAVPACDRQHFLVVPDHRGGCGMACGWLWGDTDGGLALMTTADQWRPIYPGNAPIWISFTNWQPTPMTEDKCADLLRSVQGRTLDAYDAARQARFEHGEHGR